ncbi:unnamed protein product [Lampetra planeri]
MADDPALEQTATDAAQPETEPLPSLGRKQGTAAASAGEAAQATESSPATAAAADDATTPRDVSGRDDAAAAAAFPQSEQRRQRLQLLAATGGADGSCYKCLVPFSAALLVSGSAVCALAYGRGAHGSAVAPLGLGMLALGALLAACCAVGWARHRRRRRAKLRRDSFAALVAGPLAAGAAADSPNAAG